MAFMDDEIDRSAAKWKHSLIGKFLGRGFPIDFVQKEMKIRWNMYDQFYVFSLSQNLLLFRCASEEAKSRFLQHGPWSLAGQLLALESMQPNFQPDQARVWVLLLLNLLT